MQKATILIDEYIKKQINNINLRPKEKKLLKQDFLNAFEYYKKNNISQEKVFKLLGKDFFKDFYSDVYKQEWYPLESSAKLYPMSMTHSQMSVYRLSVLLKEKIAPEILQLALNSTIKRFPIFATIMRRGVFWHYFDANRKRFGIEKETKKPCSPINVSHEHSQNFRILYYDKKISLEAFHSLTDGFGATEFLKSLTAEYIRLLGKDNINYKNIIDVNSPFNSEELLDAFTKIEDTETTGYISGNAAQIDGKRTKIQPTQLLHYIFETDKLLQVSKSFDTTITVLLLALIFISLKEASKDSKRNLYCISLPVNLRKYYSYNTLRNFSMYSIIKFKKNEITNIKELIPKISKQVKKETSMEAISKMATMTNKLTRNPIINYIPIGLKTFLIKSVYSLSENAFSATFSNLGNVDADFNNHVDKFYAILGPPKLKEMKCGLISYNNKCVLSITKPVKNNTFEKTLYYLAKKLNLNIKIEGDNN